MSLQELIFVFIAMFPFSLVALGGLAMYRRQVKNRRPKLELIRDDLSERPLSNLYSQQNDQAKEQPSEISEDAIRVSVSSKHALPKKKKVLKQIKRKGKKNARKN